MNNKLNKLFYYSMCLSLNTIAVQNKGFDQASSSTPVLSFVRVEAQAKLDRENAYVKRWEVNAKLLAIQLSNSDKCCTIM